MSVLACNRKNCKNVMCDHLSNIYGYICNDCFNELVGLGPYQDVAMFMGTPKREKEPGAPDAFDRYDKIFPSVYEVDDD